MARSITNFSRLVLFGHSHELRAEEAILANELGLPWVIASVSQVLRKRIVIEPSDLPVGSIAFMRAALQQRGRIFPAPNDYPVPLRPWLLRTPQLTSLETVLGELAVNGVSIFVKPAESVKRFTGFVLEDANDYRLAGVSRKLKVWTTPVVDIGSEWRYYVAGGRVVATGFAAPGREPDQAVVDAAVSAYAGAPDGYALDFGVLRDGRTMLIEANDGLAIGLYRGASAVAYAEVLAARWSELAAA